MPSKTRTSEDCSGKIRVRIPKKLHAKLANESYEQGMSLNSYIIYLLSYRIGQISGYQEANEANTKNHNEHLSGQHNTTKCMTIGDEEEDNIVIQSSGLNKEFF